MERVIELLYDIEEKANQIVKRASDEKKRLNSSLEQDIKRFDESILEEQREKLIILKQQIQNELSKDREALLNDCSKQIDEMELYYKNNHEQLVDKVIQSIINN